MQLYVTTISQVLCVLQRSAGANTSPCPRAAGMRKDRHQECHEHEFGCLHVEVQHQAQKTHTLQAPNPQALFTR